MEQKEEGRKGYEVKLWARLSRAWEVLETSFELL